MAEVTRKGFKDKNGNKVSLIAKVINAITGHFAGLNNKGEVVDSGYGPSDFAEASHTHGSISNFTGTNGAGASVEVGEDPDSQGTGIVKITVKGDGQGRDSESVAIHGNNIGNLIRALTAPDSTIQNNDKLALASAVHAALVSHTHYKIVEESVNGKAGVDADVDGEDGGEVTIFVKKGSGQIKSVLINDSNIANLIRALQDPAAPVSGGDNLITNGQVYAALQDAEGLTVDSALSSSSTNPVQNKEVYSALLGKMDKLPVAKLYYDEHSQDYTWCIRAGVDFLKSIIGDGPQMVVVEADIDGQPDVQFKSIGSVNVYYTSSPEKVYVELALGNYLFTWESQMQDASTQSAEFEIDYAFDEHAAGATKSTIFS